MTLNIHGNRASDQIMWDFSSGFNWYYAHINGERNEECDIDFSLDNLHYPIDFRQIYTSITISVPLLSSSGKILVIHLLNTVIDLLNTVIHLLNTVIHLLNTVIDLLNTVIHCREEEAKREVSLSPKSVQNVFLWVHFGPKLSRLLDNDSHCYDGDMSISLLYIAI